MKRQKLSFTGKILSIFICISLVLASVQLQAFAATDEEKKETLISTINSVIGLSAEVDAADENMINVTGSATNNELQTIIEIPAGVTVNWGASFDGDAAGFSQLLIVKGAGEFHLLKDGSITNTGTSSGDCAIYLEDSVTANISGKVSGKVGIIFANTATEKATVNITGGEVIGVVYGIQDQSNKDVMINISAGQISSTDSAAISAENGTVTLSGTTEITSENKSGIEARTIRVIGGTSQVTGGASGIDLSSDGSSLTIAEGATLSVQGTKGSGIAPNGSTIEVQGILNAAGEGNAAGVYGIGTMNSYEGTLNVNGGVVNATGAKWGIYVSSITVDDGVLRVTGQGGPGIKVYNSYYVQGNSHIVSSGVNNDKPERVASVDYYWYEGDDKPTSSDAYILNGRIDSNPRHKCIEFISVGHLTKTDNKDGTHTLTCDSNCPEPVTITERHHYGYDRENNDACLCGALPAAKTMVSGNGEPVWYDTFADALDAVNDNSFQGTLFLLQDMNLGDEKVIFTNEKVTLNLNGKTITDPVVVNGNTLTLVENSANAGGKADFELTSGSTITVGSALTGTYSVALLDENGNAATGTFAKVQSGSEIELQKTWFTSANKDFEVVEEENGSLALKKRIADAAVTIETESVIYTGEAFYPVVSVIWNNQTLIENTDYELLWNGNVMPEEGFINAGDYTATITGKGDYNGEKTVTFTIAKKQLTWNTSDLTASKRQDDTGEAIVYGILAVDGIVNDELTFTSPADMTTSGLAGQTTVGNYSVSVVPENNSWGFTESANYIWPDDNPTITATVNQVVETPDRPSELPEDTDEKIFKVEMESGISKVPDGLKNTDYNTPTKIETMLKTEITQVDSAIPTTNTVVYDVTLMISTDGGSTWTKATKDNFPEDGLTVTLPYPSGTGQSTHNFVVIHMFTTNDFGKKPGDTEQPAVTKTDKGIRFKVTGLSPISVGWKEIPKVTDTNTGGGSDNSESSDVDKQVSYEFSEIVLASPEETANTSKKSPAVLTDQEEETEETAPLTTDRAEEDTEEEPAEEVQEAVDSMPEEETEEEKENGGVSIFAIILIIFMVLAAIPFFILFWKKRKEDEEDI